jgi:hypothetical protein
VSGMAASHWVMRFPAGAAAAGAGGSSVTGRVVLVAIVIVAVTAFAALQYMARSRRRRSPGALDWRTFAPGYDDSDRTWEDDTPLGNQESYGPQWGYWSPPGYRGSPMPPREVR